MNVDQFDSVEWPILHFGFEGAFMSKYEDRDSFCVATAVGLSSRSPQERPESIVDSRGIRFEVVGRRRRGPSPNWLKRLYESIANPTVEIEFEELRRIGEVDLEELKRLVVMDIESDKHPLTSFRIG